MNMVADGSSSSGALWRSIRREAETALANDPIFGRSLSAAILDHSDLGAAVVYSKIGAGSVVTCDVPSGCTAIGVPARLTSCPEPAPA